MKIQHLPRFFEGFVKSRTLGFPDFAADQAEEVSLQAFEEEKRDFFFFRNAIFNATFRLKLELSNVSDLL